jgi:parallel beta-helix repeat protein
MSEVMRKIFAAAFALQLLAACGGTSGAAAQRRAATAQPAGQHVVANQMAGADLGAKINAADSALGARAGEIWVYPAQGAAGSIDTQVTVGSRHTLRFFAGLYPSSYQAGSEGIIRLKSGASAVGSGWDAILRESSRGTYNPWTVFINYDGSIDNGAASDDIHISNLKIEGAAGLYGSAKQAISLGNCRGCSVERVYLRATKSIGIQAGGGSDHGNFARDVTIADNVLEWVASQALACVNCSGVSFLRNKVIHPGPLTAEGNPPGNVPIDIEPNSPSDTMTNVQISDNVVDASGGATWCGGSICTLHGIVVQNGVGVPANRFSVSVTNNRVIGSEIADTMHHISGAGIWVIAAPNTKVVGNYAQRTMDGIKVTSASNFTLERNEIVSTGFTANFALLVEGTNVSGVVSGNTVRVDSRSPYAAGEDALIVETATSGAGVTYSSNRAGGITLSLPRSRIVGGSPR